MRYVALLPRWVRELCHTTYNVCHHKYPNKEHGKIRAVWTEFHNSTNSDYIHIQNNAMHLQNTQIIKSVEATQGKRLHSFLFPWLNSSQWARVSLLSRFHDHTQTHHTRWESSGRVISPTQRPLPDNTQHSQYTYIHAPGGIRTHNHSTRAAADPRFRSRAHWARHFNNVNHYQTACKSGHSFQHTTPYVYIYLFLYLFLFSCSPLGVVRLSQSRGLFLEEALAPIGL